MEYRLLHILKTCFDVQTKNNKANLINFIENVYDISNAMNYIHNYIPKRFYTKENNNYYSDYTSLLSLLKFTDKPRAKVVYDKLKEYDTETVVDHEKEYYKYEGKDVNIIYDHENNTAWIDISIFYDIFGKVNLYNTIRSLDRRNIKRYWQLRRYSSFPDYVRKSTFINITGIKHIRMYMVTEEEDAQFINWVLDLVNKVEGAVEL